MLTSNLLYAILALGVYYVIRKAKSSRSGKLPPGPPADPILGHLRIYPEEDQSRVFYEWSKQYGKQYK